MLFADDTDLITNREHNMIKMQRIEFMYDRLFGAINRVIKIKSLIILLRNSNHCLHLNRCVGTSNLGGNDVFIEEKSSCSWCY